MMSSLLERGLAQPQVMKGWLCRHCLNGGLSWPPGSRGHTGPEPVQVVEGWGNDRTARTRAHPEPVFLPELAGSRCSSACQKDCPGVVLPRTGSLESSVSFTLRISSTWSMTLCDHHFIAFKVPREIKAGSQFMTPDATKEGSEDTKENHL